MVNIKRWIVSQGIVNSRSSGVGNSRVSIAIHETANNNRGANANAHARLQLNGNAREASWHYQVDDKEIIQSFEDNIKCWHAGPGNQSSISIEICVNSDGNYAKAVKNAAELTRYLMNKYNIPISNVRQHNYYTGKNCPANLRSGARGINWSQFINMVRSGGTATPAPNKPNSSNKTIGQMAQEVRRGEHGNGHNNRRNSLGISVAQYELVKAEVNRLALGNPKPAKPAGKTVNQMANEIIKGLHGNGHENRRKSLGLSVNDYNEVKNEVNRLTGTPAKPKKSVAQMTQEIIKGLHGNGHENRRKSLGLSTSEYNKVKAEVNRRL